MAVTVGSIENSDAEGLAAVAERIRVAGNGTEERGREARDLARWGSIWAGSAANAASQAADSSSNRLEALGFSMSAAATVAHVHAGMLRAARDAVRVASQIARSLQFRVEPFGYVSPGIAASIPGYGAVAVHLAGTLTVVLQGAVRLVHMLDVGAGKAIQAVAFGAPAPPESIRSIPHELSATQNIPVVVAPGQSGPIITVGDPLAAESIITLVSGVGSSQPDSTERTVAWARTQVEEAATHGRSIAVVAWHDYQAPSSVPAAISSHAAREAARTLQTFQDTLRTTNPEAHLTVVGYSYGSVVSGHAAADGLTADTLHFWGSPGTGAQSAEDLQLHTRSGTVTGDARVFSTLAPGDLISFSSSPFGGIHGVDPIAPSFHAPAIPAIPAMSASSPHQPTDAPTRAPATAPASGWGSYLWRKALDAMLLSRGETNSHSSYLADPQLNPLGR